MILYLDKGPVQLKTDYDAINLPTLFTHTIITRKACVRIFMVTMMKI